MEGISGRFIVHASESFQVLRVFSVRAMSGPQTFFNLLKLHFFLVSFRSLRIDLHHVLFQLFFLSFLFLFFELVIEFGLDFGDASVFDFLPEEKGLEPRHLVISLRKDSLVDTAKAFRLLRDDVSFRGDALPLELLSDLDFELALWLAIILRDLFDAAELDSAPVQDLIGRRKIGLNLLTAFLNLI